MTDAVTIVLITAISGLITHFTKEGGIWNKSASGPKETEIPSTTPSKVPHENKIRVSATSSPGADDLIIEGKDKRLTGSVICAYVVFIFYLIWQFIKEYHRTGPVTRETITTLVIYAVCVVQVYNNLLSMLTLHGFFKAKT